MARKPVLSQEAPQPSGGYSQGIVAGGFLYLSGQGPFDAAGARVGDDGRRAGAPGAREPRRGRARGRRLAAERGSRAACTSATWRTSTRWTPRTGASSPTRCRPGRRSSPTSSASTSRATRSSGSATDVDVASLDTPVATVDLDAVERNIARMQGYCDEHGLAFRPHIKTHKLPAIAHMQLRAGAVGITCQKLGEAEVMEAAGLRRHPAHVPPRRRREGRAARGARRRGRRRGRRRLATWSRAGSRRRSPRRAPRWASSSSSTRASPARACRRPQAAADLAELADSLPGLRFDGLMTYPTLPGTGPKLRAAIDEIRARGLEVRRSAPAARRRSSRTTRCPR